METSANFLADSDIECAEARADHARAEFKAKSVRNTLLKDPNLKGSIPDRQATVETDQIYLDAKAEEFQAFFEYEKLKNRRSTAAIIIDTWRSLNAGRRSGQIM